MSTRDWYYAWCGSSRWQMELPLKRWTWMFFGYFWFHSFNARVHHMSTYEAFWMHFIPLIAVGFTTQSPKKARHGIRFRARRFCPDTWRAGLRHGEPCGLMGSTHGCVFHFGTDLHGRGVCEWPLEICAWNRQMSSQCFFLCACTVAFQHVLWRIPCWHRLEGAENEETKPIVRELSVPIFRSSPA